MGTRVHKIAGYGLDVKLNAESLHPDDPRILDWSRLTVWPEPDGVAAWARTHKDEVLALLQREHPSANAESLDLAFRWAVEDWILTEPANAHIRYSDFESSPTVVFTHPKCPQWARYDDIIDYLENVDNACEPRVQQLTRGIWPYDGRLVQVRPPEDPAVLTELAKYPVKITQHGIQMEAGEYNQLVGRWDRKMRPLTEGALLEYLLKNFRFTVPDAIILYLAWTGALTNVAAFVDDLRPMIYSYWG